MTMKWVLGFWSTMPIWRMLSRIAKYAKDYLLENALKSKKLLWVFLFKTKRKMDSINTQASLAIQIPIFMLNLAPSVNTTTMVCIYRLMVLFLIRRAKISKACCSSGIRIDYIIYKSNSGKLLELKDQNLSKGCPILNDDLKINNRYLNGVPRM